MIETLILSITSFIGTNADDIFLNTLFFAEAKTKTDDRNIVIGKYLGIGTLISLSILGAFGLQCLPRQYIGWLGLIPIGLGIKELLSAFRSKKTEQADETKKRVSHTALNTALITMANLKLVTDFSWLDLSKLDGIEDDIQEVMKKSEYPDEKRINAICEAIRKRIRLPDEMIPT